MDLALSTVEPKLQPELGNTPWTTREVIFLVREMTEMHFAHFTRVMQTAPEMNKMR